MRKTLLLLWVVFTISLSFSLQGFVYVKNGKLMLDGKEFRFLGSNCYYMHYKSNEMIDSVLESAKEMGLKVLRIWGFLDGESWGRSKRTYMQARPGVYGIPEGISGVQNGFERLDYTIMKAGELGIKLIIVLTNNWDDFGGMNQYVRWFNAGSHDDFYTDERIKDAYKNYVRYVVNRVNTYSGLLYKEDPTIMAWELANEPRCESDKTGQILVNWVREMSAYIKELDPNHLVSVGDEGFFKGGFRPYKGQADWAYSGYSGADWESLLEVETVDFGTFHLYPSHWGVKPEDYGVWGVLWIKQHAEVGRRVGKPVVLEEYGVPKNAPVDRVPIYRLWNDAAYKEGIAGSMFWMLAGVGEGHDVDESGYYPDYDGFRIVNDESEEAQLFKEYAKLFQRSDL